MIDQLAASKAADITGNIPASTQLSTQTDSYLDKLGSFFNPIEGEFDPSGQVLIEASSITPEDVHVHHIKVQEYSDEVANAVRPLIHLTRNMVVPDYSKVVEEVEAYMANMQTDISSTLGYTIEYVERCKLTLLPNITSSVGKYSNTVATIPRLPRLVSEATNAGTIASALVTTDERVNKIIADTLDAGFGVIMSVLHGGGNIALMTPGQQVITYLYAQYIYDKPEAGLGCSLIDYNEGIEDLTQQLGRRLYYYIEAWDNAVARGLVFDSPRVGKTISVNADVYRAGTARGLVPEAIFANEQLGRKYILLDHLADNVSVLVQTFEREANTLRVAFDNDANDRMRVALLAALTRLVQSKEEDGIPAPLETLIDLIQDRVRNLSHSEIADMGCTARDLVCDIIYPHSGAKTLLRTADHIGTEQPDIDPREAFAFAVAEYIAVWFADQLICK